MPSDFPLPIFVKQRRRNEGTCTSLIFDVRLKEDYVKGHSDCTVNIPRAEFANGKPGKDKVLLLVRGDRGANIGVHCYSGNWASEVQSYLRNLPDGSFTGVQNLGGYNDLRERKTIDGKCLEVQYCNMNTAIPGCNEALAEKDNDGVCNVDFKEDDCDYDNDNFFNALSNCPEMCGRCRRTTSTVTTSSTTTTTTTTTLTTTTTTDVTATQSTNPTTAMNESAEEKVAGLATASPTSSTTTKMTVVNDVGRDPGATGLDHKENEARATEAAVRTTTPPQRSAAPSAEDGGDNGTFTSREVGLMCGIGITILFAVLIVWYMSCRARTSGYNVEAAGAGVVETNNSPVKRPLAHSYNNPGFDEPTYDNATGVLRSFDGYAAAAQALAAPAGHAEASIYDNAAGSALAHAQPQVQDMPASPLYVEASSPLYATAADTNVYDLAGAAQFAAAEQSLHAIGADADAKDGGGANAHSIIAGATTNEYLVPESGQPEVYARLVAMRSSGNAPLASQLYEDIDAAESTIC